MLKTERLQVKSKLFIADGPLIRKTEKLPFSSTLLAAVVMAVQMFPFLSLFWGVPDDLRVGTKKDILSPSFQFLAAGGVQNLIIFPIICYPHSLRVILSGIFFKNTVTR